MKLWAKIYIALSAVALLYVGFFFGGAKLASDALWTEEESRLSNIVVSAKVVRNDALDVLVRLDEKMGPTRAPKPEIYLVTKAWQKVPARNVLTIVAEIESPERLRGMGVTIQGSFLDEARFDIQPLRIAERYGLSEDEIKSIVDQPARLKIKRVALK